MKSRHTLSCENGGMKMEEHIFNDIKELGSIADNLDMCRRTDSIYRTIGTDEIKNDPKRRDIINLTTNERSAVVSSVYHEYQHKDVITEVSQSFQKAKIEGHGTVYDMGDRIMTAIFFDNVQYIKDPNSDKGIQIGAMFRNSYNKQNSVTGVGYFMRIKCLNQMYLANMIDELKFSERHTGSIIDALPASIARFTDNLLMRSKFVGEAAAIANSVTVTFANRDQRLQTMIAMLDHNKVGEMVEAKLETLEPTKWDIYNAITAVTTHERMADGVRERMQKLSEKVLNPNYTVIPAILVKA